MAAQTINTIRERIDQLDAQICSLLRERGELAEKAAQLRANEGVALRDPIREAYVQHQYRTQSGLPPHTADCITQALFTAYTTHLW